MELSGSLQEKRPELGLKGFEGDVGCGMKKKIGSTLRKCRS